MNSYLEKYLDNIAEEDKKVPENVSIYAKEIFDYLRENEGKYVVNSNYMSTQEDINDKMRAILVDWLVDVHLKYKLVPETLFVCVSLIDRYL